MTSENDGASDYAVTTLRKMLERNLQLLTEWKVIARQNMNDDGPQQFSDGVTKTNIEKYRARINSIRNAMEKITGKRGL